MRGATYRTTAAFGLLIVLGCGFAAEGGSSSDPEPDEPPADQPTGTTVAGWPPAGPGCEALVACCNAASSDVTLFCQLSDATQTCDQRLASARQYISSRGTPLPGPCAPAQAALTGQGPPWVDIALPDVPGWTRAQPDDHGPDTGYIVDYDRPQSVAVTVYVYRNGMPNILRDEGMLRSELEQVMSAIQEAVRQGRYQGVRLATPAHMTRLGSAPNGPVAAHHRMIIDREGGAHTSESYVTTHRGFFFKVRTTYFDESLAAAQAVSQLMDALAAAVVE